MSNIPTQHRDGDLSIGRNLTMGGDAIVRGSLNVGHNLRVEGWLDAKNIRGANKGLFLTLSDLQAAYPTPKEGWWALVSEGLTKEEMSDHLGQVYWAHEGKWRGTRGDGIRQLGGSPTVDCEEFRKSAEQISSNVAEISLNVNGLEEDLRALEFKEFTDVKALGELIIKKADSEYVATQIGELQDYVNQGDDALSGNVSKLRSEMLAQVDGLRELIGDCADAEDMLHRLNELDAKIINLDYKLTGLTETVDETTSDIEQLGVDLRKEISALKLGLLDEINGLKSEVDDRAKISDVSSAFNTIHQILEKFQTDFTKKDLDLNSYIAQVESEMGNELLIIDGKIRELQSRETVIGEEITEEDISEITGGENTDVNIGPSDATIERMAGAVSERVAELIVENYGATEDEIDEIINSEY